jgi:hypothetical protein
MLHMLGLEEDNDYNFEAKRCLIKETPLGQAAKKNEWANPVYSAVADMEGSKQVMMMSLVGESSR